MSRGRSRRSARTKRKKKRICQTSPCVVIRTFTTSDELPGNIPLDLFWIRPISYKTSVIPGGREGFKSFFSRAAEMQSGQHHSPSVALRRRWAAMHRLPGRADASWAAFITDTSCFFYNYFQTRKSPVYVPGSLASNSPTVALLGEYEGKRD